MKLLSPKKYKAILFDIDGTLIVNKRDGIPSEKVKKIITKANKNIHISVVTSRPYYMTCHITDHLKLSGPSIISGGSQIVDVKSGNILWEQTVNAEIIENLFNYANKYNVDFNINDNGKHMQFTKKYKAEKPLSIWIHGFTYSDAELFINNILNFPEIAVHKIPSWKINKIDILITHKFGDKKHAVKKMAELLNIKTSEIIAVGDGQNDIPLFELCGLKIAMGNAVPELKAIADYIAPSVEKDGVVDIIEKFVI